MLIVFIVGGSAPDQPHAIINFIVYCLLGGGGLRPPLILLFIVFGGGAPPPPPLPSQGSAPRATAPTARHCFSFVVFIWWEGAPPSLGCCDRPADRLAGCFAHQQKHINICIKIHMMMLLVCGGVVYVASFFFVVVYMWRIELWWCIYVIRNWFSLHSLVFDNVSCLTP